MLIIVFPHRVYIENYATISGKNLCKVDRGYYRDLACKVLTDITSESWVPYLTSTYHLSRETESVRPGRPSFSN